MLTTDIAATHGKTPAQVMLRWHLQQHRQAIPKSSTPSRIAENFDIFDFALTDPSSPRSTRWTPAFEVVPNSNRSPARTSPAISPKPEQLGGKNDAYAQYFIGQSYLAPLTDGSVPVSNVSFEPVCRNNWHIHHGTGGGGDQILLCTAGSGWYQAEGEDPISMEPGSVVRVPAGTKHWHGAKADSWFSHLAFITPGEDVSNVWLEAVYRRLPQNGLLP